MLYRALSAPISVQIELTTACSNNCPHCYNYQRQEDDPDTSMSIEELRIVFEALISAKVFSITITGGEPLLRPDLVVEGIRLCKELSIGCSINTNLTVVTEETISRMKEAGPFGVLTSIASFDKTIHDAMMGRSGSFQKSLKGIELLKAQGIGFAANMVVSKMNAHQVYDTGLFIHSLGARAFSATKATPPLGCNDYSAVQPTMSQIKGSLDDLLKIQEETGMSVDILECYPLCFLGDVTRFAKFARHSCSAGITSGTIGPDGQVRPCSHSNRAYGNIFDEKLVTIYARMTEWRTGELLPETCLACKHLARCSGGCRCEAEQMGSINGMDPYAVDPASFSIPTKRVQTEINLESTTRVIVNPSVKFREEEFGYVLWNKHETAMVDKAAGILLQTMQTTEMTLEDAVAVSNSNVDKVSSVLKNLITKKMVRFS